MTRFQKYNLPTLLPEVLSYVAGIIDGEGSIVIQRKKKETKNGRIRFRIEIYNSNKEMLDWIAKKFRDGKVKEKNPLHISRRGYGTKAQMYFWIVNKQEAVYKILVAILPYLIIKKSKAGKAIAFIEERVTNPRQWDKAGSVVVWPNG